jgi:hypothetical protein
MDPIDDDDLGPIDYVAVEFPQGRVTAAGFDRLLDAVDRRVITILDLEFVAKDGDGVARRVELGDLANPDGVDLTVWEGAASGLLGDDDVAEIGAAIAAGSVAVIVVFENRWVLDVVDAWRHEGARLVLDGGLPADDVVAALDATEPG